MRFWGSSKLDEIGWCWMHIQAWIWWRGILLQSQFSLFLCILKPETYAQKLDRSKTPAQLHIMNWHPDYIYIYILIIILYIYIPNIQRHEIQSPEELSELRSWRNTLFSRGFAKIRPRASIFVTGNTMWYIAVPCCPVQFSTLQHCNVL